MSSIEVQCWVEVELSQFETEDLVDELEKRRPNLALGGSKTEYELNLLKDRCFEARRREVTQGRPPSQEERDFWYHVHGRDL